MDLIISGIGGTASRPYLGDKYGERFKATRRLVLLRPGLGTAVEREPLPAAVGKGKEWHKKLKAEEKLISPVCSVDMPFPLNGNSCLTVDYAFLLV